jgi:AhpD family alkylhydroperoxidase
MSRFPIHTLDTAPAESKERLLGLKQAVGMVPNLAAGMAESPALLSGFLAVREIYQRSTLSPAEVQVVSLTAAYENECAWCMAFHSLMAGNEGVSEDDVHALRTGRTPRDQRFGALSDFARTLVQRRGAVDPKQLSAFLDAGYAPQQALDVILGLAFSLMANYAGHLVNPPLDAPLEAHAWKVPAALTRDVELQLAST